VTGSGRGTAPVDLVSKPAERGEDAMGCRLCVSFAMAVGLVTQIEVGAEDPTLDACVDDRRLDGDADQGFEQTWLRTRQCAAAARAIVSAGTDADRERLWFLFDQLPEDSPVAGEVLDAFLDRQVARALAALDDRAPPTVNEAPSVDVEIPDFLRLSAETARDGIEAMPVLVAVDLPVVSSRITFPRSQQCHYQVWLSRGADLHMSPTADVGEDPATVTVSEDAIEEPRAEPPR
jgi:hypothetical protein